jgi:putative ABC transport system permease protein
LAPSRYREEQQKSSFYRVLLERVRALPGVEAAAATNHLPMVSDFARAFTIGGRPVPLPGEWPAARFRAVTPDYFRAMGIPLLRGRVFTEQDDAEAPGVALINQSLARRYWPGEDPLGQRVNLARPEVQHAWRTVVGVVGDVRHAGLDAEIQPEVYAPYYQMAEPSTTLVVRAVTEPLMLAAAVRAAVRAVDLDQPVSEVRTMPRVVAESEAMGSRRTVLLLLSAFAVLAMLLATVGVYGVISYSVAQRTQEIGVRMALGAASGDLVWMVVRQALGLALAGVIIGTLAGLALTRFLSKLAFGVSPADPATFAAVAALLLAVALAASYLPARAATRVDPLTALRAA